MKKIFAIVALALSSVLGFAQDAAIPTLIVFPADTWMLDHGYMRTFDNDGETEYIPNYNDAFVQTRDLNSAITAVQKVFAERKFQHEDLAQVLKDMKSERAFEVANAADGNGVNKSMTEELLQQARPDIIVYLDYTVKPFGPRNSITFELKAVDAYCKNEVAAVQGIIENTMDPVDLALRKSVSGKCDDFCAQMMDYFRDLHDNGRQINVVFKATSASGINMKVSEIGDDEDTYEDFLVSWVRKNSINRSGKKGRVTKNMVEMKNIRIPFFTEDGDPMEATDWAKKAYKQLRKETGIRSMVGDESGLGQAVIYIGVEE